MIGLDSIEQAKAKLIAGAIVIVVLFAAGVGLYALGRHEGAKLERADWLKVEAQRAEATTKLLREHTADMQALQRQFDTTNRQVSDNYENEIATLRRAHDADRAAADRAGGLRIPRAVCNPPATVPETAGAGRGDEASTATVRLPREVENDLWAIADDADQVSLQLGACQAWIRANGFYGPQVAGQKELLDRMTAVNQEPGAPHADD